MHTLQRCYVRSGTQWMVRSITEINGQSPYQLLQAYDQIRLYVITETEQEGVILLHSHYPQLSQSQRHQTIGQWLASLTGVEAIDPSFDGKLLNAVGKMRCRDLWQHAVKVDLWNHNYGEGSEIPHGLYTDIRIRPSVANSPVAAQLADHALLVVNGRIVKTTRVGDTWFGLHAAKRFSSNPLANTLTTIDLRELGSWTWIDLNDGNTEQLPSTPALASRHQSRLKVTTTLDLANKTVLAILNGCPYFLDPRVNVYDGNTVHLTLDHRQAAHLLLKGGVFPPTVMASVNVRDSGYSLNSFNPLAYVQTTVSALLVIDNPDINHLMQLAGRTDLPGLYTFPYPPQGLLLQSDNEISEYWVDGYDGDQAAISAVAGYRPEYLMDQTVWEEDIIVCQSQHQPKSPTVQECRFLDLYTTLPQ